MRVNKKIWKAHLGQILVGLVFFLFPFVGSSQQKIEQWGRYEASFDYAFKGNPYLGVNISAKFTHKDSSITVQGFYDGNNTFKVRFMPGLTGTWNYETVSNIKALNGKKGSFDCVGATTNNHGMVRVSNTNNFKYEDGKPYYPVGTTAYAWNHMGKGLQQITLQSLRASGFNKLRMCVFPKNYDLVKEEPEIYPFAIAGNSHGTNGGNRIKWDLAGFNPEFFQTLEKQIEALDDLGIEVDLILFHPYDKGRWGFDSLPMEINKRYLQYILARLGYFRNIWWSVANEWDLVKYKTHDEWLELSKYIYENGPYRHLSSIHGSTAKYIEYWQPYFTHASIQDEAPVMNWGAASILRNVYQKPIVYDEVGYEGNLKQRWGRYSGEEMNHLMWMGAIGGTYVTHGECYMYHGDKDTIFWAKGGAFKGTSWKRAAFLRAVLEAGPQPLAPADVSRDMKTATAGDGNYLIYFGKEINEYWYFNLPAKNNGPYAKPVPGKQYKVELIDTWDMTVTPVQETFETGKESDYRLFDRDMKKIRMPLKPYLALRITQLD